MVNKRYLSTFKNWSRDKWQNARNLTLYRNDKTTGPKRLLSQALLCIGYSGRVKKKWLYYCVYFSRLKFLIFCWFAGNLKYLVATAPYVLIAVLYAMGAG